MVAASSNLFGITPSGYLSLPRGYTVEYFEAGEGEPLVVVPGLAGGVGLLEPLIVELSKRFRVYSYQLRGEGRELFDRGFSFHQLVDDLGDVIAALRIERPGLLGVSFGGAIALQFAARHSGHLSHLAVQGVGAKFRPGMLGEIASDVLNRLPLPDNNPFINQVFRILIGHTHKQDAHLDFVVDRCWRTDQSIMAHRFGLLHEYNLERELSRVQVPTLVLGAEQDIFVPVRDSMQLARRIPHAAFRKISDAGHLAFVTDPALVTGQIEAFTQIRQSA